MISLGHLSEAVEAFLMQMAADDRAQSSIKSYRRQLELLVRGIGDIAPCDVTALHLNDYLTSTLVQLRADGTPREVGTLNRVKSVIRAFFRWCEQTGLIDRSPAARVRLGVPAPPVTRYMSRGELARLLRAIRRNRHPLAPRDHAIFSTLAYTGLRLSEVIRLRWRDVDLGQGRLILQRTKGGGREMRHISTRLRPVLSRILRSRPAEPGPSETVFVNHEGRPLSPRTVQYRFAFWLHRAGIRKPLSVHSLRHTFGTLLYRATQDLVLVGRALGHRDVKSTQRYAHLDDRALTKAIDRMW